MYKLIEKLHTLYGLLQDEQSKEIFQARFAIDMESSEPNIKRLGSIGNEKEGCMYLKWSQPHKEILKQLNREHKKIVLYGTGHQGLTDARVLESEDISFYGFCGRRFARFPNGLLGKPVLSPDDLVAHGNEYYVILSVGTKKSYTEISKFLQNHSFPKEHILDWIDPVMFSYTHQYFEFPKLYHRGTAFIDGGCYDCGTSYRFVEWCGGEYSSIIAFEPDPSNYVRCCDNLQYTPIPNFQLINAGMSGQEGTAVFNAQSTGSSHIIPASFDSNKGGSIIGNKTSIRTVAIDDIVDDRTVGFIKMDIEGAELDALHGAKNTIIRDEPLLAICVYHLRGDVFAIMDYLHQLLPEYRFLLRHYTAELAETVLYASVDL